MTRMTRMPGYSAQSHQLLKVESAIHEIIDLGQVRVLGSPPFDFGPNDEYLAFGSMWLRYSNSGVTRREASTPSTRSCSGTLRVWQPSRGRSASAFTA